MTAICTSGGPSSPKGTTPDTIIYNSGGIAAVLELAGYAALSALAVVVGVIAYDALTLCALDPPSIVALTNDEYVALHTLTLGADFVSGLGKLKDIVLSAIWYQVCQCTSGGTPGIPTVSVVPTTVALAPGSASCASIASAEWTRSQLSTDSAGQATEMIGLNPGAVLASGAGAGFADALAIPAGATSVQLTGQFISRTAAYQATFVIEWFSASGTNLHQDGVEVFGTPPGASSLTAVVPTVAGGYSHDAAYFLAALVSATYGVTVDLVGIESLVWFCGGAQTTSPAQPCCVDPTLALTVQQLLVDVSALQARLIPTSYVAGTVHSGLTGQGTFAATGLLGILVELTTIPGNVSSVVGEPVFYFTDSWVSLLNPDGMVDNRRITAATQVWAPRLASDATVWGYSFAAGIVASITELHTA